MSRTTRATSTMEHEPEREAGVAEVEAPPAAIQMDGTEDQETVLQKLNESMARIRFHTSRTVSNKLSFTRADQQAVEESLCGIALLFGTAKVRAAEAEIRQIREEVARMRARAETEAREAAMEGALEGAKEAVKTIAKAAGKERKIVTKTDHKASKPKAGKPKEGTGKTCPSKKGGKESKEKPRNKAKKPSYAAVVGTKDGEGDTAEELAKRIEAGELDGGFTLVRRRKNGKILLMTESEEKHKKLLEAAKREETNLTTEPAVREDGPATLKVVGVEGGLTAEQLREYIARENRAIFKGDVREAIMVIKKMANYDRTKEDWVIRTNHRVAEAIREAGNRISVELRRVKTVPWKQLFRCFNCSEFGHKARMCRNRTCCPRCGGAHELRDCGARTMQCPACDKRGLPSKGHAAFMRSCETYRRQMDRRRQEPGYKY